MENQHRKINGYRDLSQAEIDLMNRVKAQGAELEALIRDVQMHVRSQRAVCANYAGSQQGEDEKRRIDKAEPERWAALGRTHFQEGLMALTRAVAQPENF